ncbi:hypothetical protein E4S40_13010 [Algoriphagus kandeliae]|uniref:Uncharacterized protein n=1 Tax=Algoriphagus kandeliae TaxID=2562278 RepID=A0A4Y9QMV1_9BACT|nr:hypothetical protein [Algoriphagus kandeliae]TFV93178.1 hypothetical protein E4S40_13010 [Algoriphagus kandeliae]
MLQDLIKDLQSTLKSYSQGLAKQNLLVDIPWTMVDGDLNLQRLIFRKDNSLYIVREGEIQESKWEYLPAMNSLVIEVGGKKILMNEIFADGKALLLKKDGGTLEFLAFANQKELPDLRLREYLNDITEYPKRIKDKGERIKRRINRVTVILVLIYLLVFLLIFFSKR